jgi:hypothetical protein
MYQTTVKGASQTFTITWPNFEEASLYLSEYFKAYPNYSPGDWTIMKVGK